MSAGSGSSALLQQGGLTAGVGLGIDHNELCRPRGLLSIRPTARGNVAMTRKRALLAIIMVVLAVIVFFAWMAWNDGHFGWAHIAGMGLSILLLVLIWFWPGTQQPTRPPP